MSEAGHVARNAPCPCGSGRKYKRCCGRGAPPTWSGSSPWHRMRRAEGRLVPEVWDWAQERYGDDLMSVVWWDFIAAESEDGELYDGPPEEHDEFVQQFIPWVVFGWVADPEDDPDDWPRQPLGQLYLAERGDRLDAFERRFLEAACASTASFHQVQEVEPGESMLLRDLMTGKERRVLEKSSTQSLARGAVLFARVVALDGTAILSGSGLYMLPPDRAPMLLDLREDLAGGPDPISSEELRQFEPELRVAYFDFVYDLLHPVPRVLHNSDGDLFELIELSYELGCSPLSAFDALRDLAPGTRKRDLLAGGELDETGELRAVELPWLQRGSKPNGALDHTVLGRIEIRDARLTVEVNSRRRAHRVRRLIQRRLGHEATFRGERVQAMEELLESVSSNEHESAEDRQQRAERERLESVPEMRALTERLRADFWTDWLDEELPALGGRTPRNAARDPRGRERLEALLRDFEWRGTQDAGAENPMAPDVQALRRALGLVDSR